LEIGILPSEPKHNVVKEHRVVDADIRLDGEELALRSGRFIHLRMVTKRNSLTFQLLSLY
jgi:hypothetical protein